MSRAHQDAVIFVGIQRAYEPSSDIVVRFQRGASLLVVAHEDWVGLFRVGWTSVRERVTSALAPQPAPNQLESKVTFAGSNMPAEDGRFYQFCYVTKEGAVRGASAPFQFTRSRKEAGTEPRRKEASAEAFHQATPADHEAGKQEKDKIIEDGRRLVASLEDKVKEKTSLLDEADSRLRACLETNAQLQGRLDEEAEKNKRLQAAVWEGQECCQAALKQRDTLQGELERTRAERNELEAALEDQKERLNRASATHQEELETLKAEGRSRVAEMEDQALMLHQVQDQARVLEEKLVGKEEELRLLKQTLEAELDQARAEKQHYEVLAASVKNENSKLEETLQRQTSELVNLKERLVEKQSELEKKHEHLPTQGNVGELSTLPTPNPAADNTVERSVYDALQVAYECLERHYQEARDEQEQEDARKAEAMAAYVRGLESQCDELRARVIQCKKEYEAKAKECLDLRMRGGAASRADVTEYQTRIKSLEQQMKGLLENHSKLSKELEDREETIRQQGVKIGVLEEQLVESEQRYEELKEQSGLLEVQRDSLRGHLRESLSASLSRVCPICSIEFSLGAPAIDFEHHVNSHLHD